VKTKKKLFFRDLACASPENAASTKMSIRDTFVLILRLLDPIVVEFFWDEQQCYHPDSFFLFFLGHGG